MLAHLLRKDRNHIVASIYCPFVCAFFYANVYIDDFLDKVIWPRKRQRQMVPLLARSTHRYPQG